MNVENTGRYQRRLFEANPSLQRVMSGHITLVLVSDTYLDSEATVFFDDLIALMQAVVARSERQLSDDDGDILHASDRGELTPEDELTPEEAGVGHIAELS